MSPKLILSSSTFFLLRIEIFLSRFWYVFVRFNDVFQLRDWADILLIAPLSANTLAKISSGLCDNLLTCVCRAWPLSSARFSIYFENEIEIIYFLPISDNEHPRRLKMSHSDFSEISKNYFGCLTDNLSSKRERHVI